MITTYTCSWQEPRGSIAPLDTEFPTAEEALAFCDKILRIREEAGTYPVGFAETCVKLLSERVSPVAEWTLDTATVLLDEEHGYREWIWHTGMTDAELITFWKTLPSVSPYFITPVGLPGTLIPCWFGAHADKGIWTYDLATFKMDKEGNPTGKEVFLKWPCGEDPRKNRWMGHIHMDDDSGIGHPDHGRITHAGFRDLGRDQPGPLPTR